MNAKNEMIIKLRRENYSYEAIAQALNVSKNTVQSVCRREKVRPENGKHKDCNDLKDLKFCKYCGMLMANDWNRKGKQFCSDQCRTRWWNQERRDRN